jgi:glycine/D-amino acid oxidase-like deaminating enzyme
MERRNVRVHCSAEVHRLSFDGHGFLAETKDGRTFKADRVIVAAGGKASPQCGSNGSGFDLVKSLGHRALSHFPGSGATQFARAVLGRGGRCSFQRGRRCCLPGEGSEGRIGRNSTDRLRRVRHSHFGSQPDGGGMSSRQTRHVFGTAPSFRIARPKAFWKRCKTGCPPVPTRQLSALCWAWSTANSSRL